MNNLSCVSENIAQLPEGYDDDSKPSPQELFYARKVHKWSVEARTSLHVVIYCDKEEEYEIISSPRGSCKVRGVWPDNMSFSPKQKTTVVDRTIHGNPQLSFEENVLALGVSDLAYKRWGVPLRVLVQSEQHQYAIEAHPKKPTLINITIRETPLFEIRSPCENCGQ